MQHQWTEDLMRRLQQAGLKVVMTEEAPVKAGEQKKTGVWSCARYDEVRDLAHRLKERRIGAVSKAADRMEVAVQAVPGYRDCVLVPVPGRDGVAGYTRALADELGARLRLPVADVLTGGSRISLYDYKKEHGLTDLPEPDFSLKGSCPADKKILLVDNVLDTGTTLRAAVKALGRNVALVVLGHTDNTVTLGVDDVLIHQVKGHVVDWSYGRGFRR